MSWWEGEGGREEAGEEGCTIKPLPFLKKKEREGGREGGRARGREGGECKSFSASWVKMNEGRQEGREGGRAGGRKEGVCAGGGRKEKEET